MRASHRARMAAFANAAVMSQAAWLAAACRTGGSSDLESLPDMRSNTFLNPASSSLWNALLIAKTTPISSRAAPMIASISASTTLQTIAGIVRRARAKTEPLTGFHFFRLSVRQRFITYGLDIRQDPLLVSRQPGGEPLANGDHPRGGLFASHLGHLGLRTAPLPRHAPHLPKQPSFDIFDFL